MITVEFKTRVVSAAMPNWEEIEPVSDAFGSKGEVWQAAVAKSLELGEGVEVRVNLKGSYQGKYFCNGRWLA